MLIEITESRRPEAASLLEPAGTGLAATALDEDAGAFGIEEAGRLVGCVVVRDRDDESSEILAIAVLPERRRTGIGRTLVTELRDRGRPLVAETSEEAVAFFRSCGFAITSKGGTPYRRRYVCELC
jgi:ribosomal protein S18 acetylase RimI-like enzyme